MMIQGEGIHTLDDVPRYDGPLEFTLVGTLPPGWEVSCKLNGISSRGARLKLDTVYEPRQIANQVITFEVKHDSAYPHGGFLIETVYAPRATELRPQNVEELIPYYRPIPPYAGGDDGRGSRVGLFAFYAMEQSRQVQVNNDGLTIAGSLIPAMENGTEEPTNYFDMTSPVDINAGTDPLLSGKYEYVTIRETTITEDDQYIDILNGQVITTSSFKLAVLPGSDNVRITQIPVAGAGGFDLDNATSTTLALPEINMGLKTYPESDSWKDCVTYANGSRALLICRMDRSTKFYHSVLKEYMAVMNITYMPYPYDVDTMVHSTLNTCYSIRAHSEFTVATNADMSTIVLLSVQKGAKFLTINSVSAVRDYMHVSLNRGRTWDWTGPDLLKYPVTSRQRMTYYINEATMQFLDAEQLFLFTCPGMKMISSDGLIWEQWLGSKSYSYPRYTSDTEPACAFAPYLEPFYQATTKWDSSGSINGQRLTVNVFMNGDWNTEPALLASVLQETGDKLRYCGFTKLHLLNVGLTEKPKEGMGFYVVHDHEYSEVVILNQALYTTPTENSRPTKLSLVQPYLIGSQHGQPK